MSGQVLRKVTIRLDGVRRQLNSTQVLMSCFGNVVFCWEGWEDTFDRARWQLRLWLL